MATKDWRQTSDIKKELTKNGNQFSFIQAVRLLNYIIRKDQQDNNQEDINIGRSIRVRPKLSLDFPANDIDSIEKIPGGNPLYLFTVTFLGLYGVSSPLPTFYTEDLMDEASDDVSVTRDFIDIINVPFYRLFYQCWSKYRQFVKIVDEQDTKYLEKLYCFLGLGIEKHRQEIKNVKSLIPYIGLFTQFPRSAQGLNRLLSDALQVDSMEIDQCIHRMASIPEDQRFFLGVSGSELGLNSYVGQEIDDRMGSFRIRIGPVDADTFHNFLPDTVKFETMTKLIRLYLDKPLIWETQIILRADEVRKVCLGKQRWSSLGWDTWVFSDENCLHDVSTRFQGEFHQFPTIFGRAMH